MPAVVLAHGVIQAMIVTKLKTVVVLLAALCLLGSGAGLLSWEVAAKADPGTLAAPAPMKNTKDETPESAPDQHRLELAEQLKRPVNFAGIEVDRKETLQDAVEQIQKRYNLQFDVNAKAFADEKVEDVLTYAIVEHTALPAMTNVRLDTVLKQVLKRVPTESGATWIIRGDLLEVTTQAALRAEFGRKGKEPLPPLVCAQVRQTAAGRGPEKTGG